jgi:hypothetical protein
MDALGGIVFRANRENFEDEYLAREGRVGSMNRKHPK